MFYFVRVFCPDSMQKHQKEPVTEAALLWGGGIRPVLHVWYRAILGSNGKNEVKHMLIYIGLPYT